MSAEPQGPLTVGELLDRSWDVIRRRFGTLLFLILPAQVLSELLPEPGVDDVPAMLTIGLVLALGFYCVGMGGAAFVVEGESSGTPVRWPSAWRLGLEAALRVLVANLLAVLGIVLLLLLLIVPGIWFAGLVSLAPTVAALERRWAGALSRSQELVRGRWWRTAGLLSPLVLLVVPLGILDVLVPEDQWTRWLLVLGNTVLGIVASTLPVIIYHDYARSRLAASVASAAETAPAAATTTWPNPTPSGPSEAGPPPA